MSTVEEDATRVLIFVSAIVVRWEELKLLSEKAETKSLTKLAIKNLTHWNHVKDSAIAVLEAIEGIEDSP